MSLKKNLLKNGIASSIQKGVRVLEQLLLVPFFISAWGAAYYGEWLTLTIIPTMLAFSDLGFGSAAANSLVLRYASGDKQGAANIAKSGILIITVMVACSLVISVIFLLSLDHYKIFEKSLINRGDAIWAVFILMVARILNFYQQLFEAYFRAARKASLSINLLSIQSCLYISGGLIVLLSGGGIVAFASVNLVIAIIYNPIYALKASRVLALNKTNKGVIQKSVIRAITIKGFGYLMAPVWQAVFFQGTTFVVRIVLGPEAVAIFNTVRTVTRVINQSCGVIISTVLPEMQFEIGSRNMLRARQIFRLSLVLVVVVALVGSVFLYFGGSWFYELWTRKALTPPAMMWNVFIIGIGFNAVWWTTSFVFTAMNKPYDFAVAGVISALLSVISSYYLANVFGLTGAAVGSLIMDILLFLYIIPRSCKLIGQAVGSLLQDSFIDIKAVLYGQIKPISIEKRYRNEG